MINVAVPITGKEEFKLLKKVVYSGRFVSGKNVELFEKKFANYIGTKFAVCFNSGTAALHASLGALNLKPKDEVIVPAISFISSATAILHQGCKAVFCDVNLDDYCMNIESLKNKITKNTKAIIPVHFAGSACDMKKISNIAKKFNLKIIEDCSQAHGTKILNKKVGSFGNSSCFSFYATKHMTTGEGGVLCTNDKKIYNFCKSFRTHGMVDRDTHKFLGYNYRMGEINAAIGLAQIKKLDKINKKRVENSKYIINGLKKSKKNNTWFKVQEIKKGVYHTYFWCPVRILSKSISINDVREKLRCNLISVLAAHKIIHKL